ncbi:hypothetical protein ACL7TT_09715 [Microbulbifer sp. 2304DJ12-6]|uniref:hypothetical protein n=1 Tax=Microbulbifer sp. 2304DJ12-6 TaxID=3233340 RepID=UPI0039AEA6F1
MRLGVIAKHRHERLKEVNKLAASLRRRESAEFVTEHRNKLAQRSPLNQAGRRLSTLRKQRERIMVEDIPRKVKLLRLDVIQKKINLVLT